MNLTNSDTQPISTEQITARARELWQTAGSPDGRDLEFWLAAEQELAHDREQVAQTQHGDATPPKATPGGKPAESAASEASKSRRSRKNAA